MKTSQNSFLTKIEFCEICGICPSTAYKLLKSEKIKFEKIADGNNRHYKIPYSEAEKFISEKQEKGILNEKDKKKLVSFYRRKLSLCPEVILAKDVQDITGYGKETVRQWIMKDILPGVNVRKRFRIAKDDLIDFMVSPYYITIKRKSEKHRYELAQLGISNDKEAM